MGEEHVPRCSLNFPVCHNERGRSTATEYGLMVAFIAIVIIGGVSAFGVAVSDLFLIPSWYSDP